MTKHQSDITYGIEYNFKDPQQTSFGKAPNIDSVFLLNTKGKIPVALRDCAEWEGFRQPFSLLCENTPFRTTFYYETYNQLMMPDWLCNKNVITLVGLQRVSNAIMRYNNLPSTTTQIDFTNRIDYTKPVVGEAIVDYSTGVYIRSDKLTLPSGTQIPIDQDLLCYPYLFIYDDSLRFDYHDTWYYHWRLSDVDINNTRKDGKPFTNLINMTQDGNITDNQIPLYIVDRSDCIPNIHLEYFNVML